MFRSALVFAGYQVREASDGTHALRLIDEEPPDLVVLDLLLPLLDGLAVQQEIASHAHTKDIPVVVVTGSAMSLEGLDVSCVLRKPVGPDELLGIVRSCLAIGASSAGT